MLQPGAQNHHGQTGVEEILIPANNKLIKREPYHCGQTAVKLAIVQQKRICGKIRLLLKMPG